MGLGAGAAYALVVRPRISHWGATAEDVRKPPSGDELDSPFGYRPISTRAITIDASPAEVWPWLVQMGSGRAGFYTHEWVERLLAIAYSESRSATRIHPEFQDLVVGDRVPCSRFNSVAVTFVDRPRCLIAGEWLVLEPLDGGRRTRLIARTRGGWLEPFARKVPVMWPFLWPLAALIDRGPVELLHHYMETGMLQSIKARAEAAAWDAHPRGSAGCRVSRADGHRFAVAALKTVHTAIFLAELSSIGWLVVTGLVGRRDRTVALAAGAVALEAAVFLGNDRVCPLTPLTERLGASNAAVSDIFLPDFLARTIPIWSSVLVGLAAVLHSRSKWPVHDGP